MDAIHTSIFWEHWKGHSTGCSSAQCKKLLGSERNKGGVILLHDGFIVYRHVHVQFSRAIELHKVNNIICCGSGAQY